MEIGDVGLGIGGGGSDIGDWFWGLGLEMDEVLFEMALQILRKFVYKVVSKLRNFLKNRHLSK